MANPSSDFGNSVATSALNRGTNAINSFDPTGTKTKQQGVLGSSGLGGLLGDETRDYISRYSDAVAKNPSVTQLYEQGNQAYNVPQLAKTANYLQNTVTNAIPDAYQGARGFDISDSQVQNGVAQKLAYLTPQMTAATNNLNTAQGLAAKFVEAGQAQNAMNLLPIQAEQQNLLQQQAAQATGWNQAAQMEFQGLIDKMNAGVTLSQAELNRANVLAQMETSYQNTIIEANAAISVAKLNNQYQTVPYGGSLVNTFSGGVINPGVLTGASGQYQLR